MGMVILGWALIVVGVLFLLLALAAVGKRTFGGTASLGPDAFSLSLKDVVDLLKALKDTPQWLLMAVVGATPIYFGIRLVNGLPLPF